MPTNDQLLDEQAVAEIEARANAATKGPWKEYHRVSPRGAYQQWHIGNKDGLCQITMVGHEHDYHFMAHAREDVPALCATVKQLREENQRLTKHVADLNHDLNEAIKECNEHSNH